jgi:hypothetical protein
MAKTPEPPNLFWLTYRHSDGSTAGVVVIESRGLLRARLKASLAARFIRRERVRSPATQGASLGVVGSRPLRYHLFDDAAR